MYDPNDDVVPDVTGTDFSDTVEVSNSIAKDAATIHKARRAEALSMFRAGVKLVKYDGEITIREFGRMTDVPYPRLSVAKTVAKKYDMDEEKFLKDFDGMKGARTWHAFVRIFIDSPKPPVGEVYKRDILKLKTKVFGYLKSQKDNDEVMDPSSRVGRTLMVVRDAINRFYPLEVTVADESQLKYYECCCCGAYPPPEEGYELKDDEENEYLKYPVCEECNKALDPPNYKIIAKMYATYALNIEKGYEDLLHGFPINE